MREKNDIVLIIGAGMLQVPMIRQAKSMGLAVATVDGDQCAQGMRMADHAFHIDTYDAQGIGSLAASLADEHNLLGVCTTGADVAPSVAMGAAKAGTPGISYEVAMRTHDKASVRARLDRAGLWRYQPRWQVCRGKQDRSNDYCPIAFPFVIKPLSQRASRGVTIVQSSRDVPAAISKAVRYGDSYLLEECLLGTEHSAEIIYGTHGWPVWWNIVDRIFTYNDGMAIEMGHVNPTQLGRVDAFHIFDMVNDAAKALGVNIGPFKCDVIMTHDGPKILECTARLSGGFDSQGTSPMTGRHPMRIALQVACGMPVDMTPVSQGYAACAAVMAKTSGALVDIPMCGQSVIWAARHGSMVGPAQHCAERVAFVLAHSETYALSWDAAKDEADWISDELVIE